ncbi:D-glucuronyl C5-epimerase family protein [Deferribacteres bacterium DY0037]
MKKNNILKSIIFIIIILACFGFTGIDENPNHISYKNIEYNQGEILETLEAQTDVNNAKFVITNGVPYLDIENVGVVFHPAWTGLYALQYADAESYYPKEVEPNDELFFDLVNILEKKLSYLDKDSAVWLYDFDNTYNNVFIKAPWYSSFAQAIGIEVFITAYEKTQNQKYLELAKVVAKPLITPIRYKGLMYVKESDIWFEEIPLKESPTHILNAQLRTLIALDMLYKNSGESIYKEYFDKGLQTLKKWLSKYDAGYWLKYDLNPSYVQLFRITNPYGFNTVELAIDSISILDKNQEVLLQEDIGDGDDFDTSKAIYLSGIDWKGEYKVNDQTLREIKSSLPVDFKTEFESQGLVGPYTFLNVNLPITKEKEYFVKIDYKDNIKGNLVLQKRAIAPDIKFEDVDNGIFLLKGDSNNRSLIVKISESDMGYHVGVSYAWKHYLYLRKIQDITKDKNIARWAGLAKSYINLVEYQTDEVVKNESLVLPVQTPMSPLMSFSEDMVVRQHITKSDKPFFYSNKMTKDEVPKPVISPYIVALQADGSFAYVNQSMFKSADFLEKILGENFDDYHWITLSNKELITKENAIRWLKNNSRPYKDALAWSFDFANSYNDMMQEPGWNSAFGQAYVIKAFLENNMYDYAAKGANAYKYDIADGGVSSFDKSGNIWFEEVPNKSHILNAHLISENVLLENSEKFNDKEISDIADNGVSSLGKYISDFDTGYWSKYDQNPKKELLFQFDWVDGRKSPLIDEVCLVSSVSHTKTCLDVGSKKDYESSDRITGLDWLASFEEDGKTVRNFRNGYSERTGTVSGGTRHNAFVWMSLPDREFIDQWDITPYYLVIKYKDVEKGQFIVKSQSMREGNFLEFMPLYSSNIITSGDGKWKERIIPVRTNDLGWYLGVDYHKYHIVQLNDLSKKINSTALKQLIDRWQYYLEEFENKQNPIVEPERNPSKELENYKVKSNLKYYKGYELANAVDGDPSSNYIAAFENIPKPHIVTIDLAKKAYITEFDIIWESHVNYASRYNVSVFDGKDLVFEKNIENSSQYSKLPIDKKATKVVLSISEYHGQDRFLCRAIRLYGKEVE